MTAIRPARASGPRFDNMILRDGSANVLPHSTHWFVITATRSGDLMPWLPPMLCVWCALNFFQLPSINLHRPWSPSSPQTYLSVPSRSKRGMVLSISVFQSVWLENAALRMSLKSVRWKESLTSSSKMDTTENVFDHHNSKKSYVPDGPANRCKSSEKATAKRFAVCAETPSDVNVCSPCGSCHQIVAIACRCAWLCSIIA